MKITDGFLKDLQQDPEKLKQYLEVLESPYAPQDSITELLRKQVKRHISKYQEVVNTLPTPVQIIIKNTMNAVTVGFGVVIVAMLVIVPIYLAVFVLDSLVALLLAVVWMVIVLKSVLDIKGYYADKDTTKENYVDFR